MADFSDGVSGYLVAKGGTSNGFPIDMKGNKVIACIYCHLYERHDNICFDTKEIIFKPQIYIGHRCPLKDDIIRQLNKEEI